MKKLLAIILVVVLLISQSGILLAAHSNYGCDGCHTPHNSTASPSVPLWNGSETTQTFTMYSSGTFDGNIDGQPTGTSRLCLGCHDGTNPRISMESPRSFGGDKLSRSHPISFIYDSALAVKDHGLKDPSEFSTLGDTIAKDLLDPDSKMQCTSCHDIHTSGVGENLLRGYDYTHGPGGGNLCRMCHNK